MRQGVLVKVAVELAQIDKRKRHFRIVGVKPRAAGRTELDYSARVGMRISEHLTHRVTDGDAFEESWSSEIR